MWCCFLVTYQSLWLLLLCRSLITVLHFLMLCSPLLHGFYSSVFPCLRLFLSISFLLTNPFARLSFAFHSLAFSTRFLSRMFDELTVAFINHFSEKQRRDSQSYYNFLQYISLCQKHYMPCNWPLSVLKAVRPAVQNYMNTKAAKAMKHPQAVPLHTLFSSVYFCFPWVPKTFHARFAVSVKSLWWPALGFDTNKQTSGPQGDTSCKLTWQKVQTIAFVKRLAKWI